MSINACIGIIKKAASNQKIDDDTAMALLEEIDEFITQQKSLNGGPDDLDGALSTWLNGRLNEALLSNMLERRNRMINAMVEARAIQFINQFDNPADGLRAMMGGVVKSTQGGKLSVDAQGKALGNKYIGRLLDRIDKDGDLKLWRSGKIDDLVAKEMWQLREGGQPGITGHAAAERIAKHIHVMQETAIGHANQAGAYIKSMPGYIMRQGHNQVKIRKAGFEAWRDFVITKLDAEKTFGTANPDEFLKGAYNGLATGMHNRFKGGAESNYIKGFKGPANMAKKMSQERVLHFKDAESFMEYNKKFGTNDLREATIRGLEHMARNTALMRRFGTNPLAMFEKLQKRFASQLQKEANVEKFDKLTDYTLTNLFKEIDGSTRIAARPSMAQINAGLRAVQNMAKLGGAVVSSVTDIPNQAAELRHQGIHPLMAYANGFANLFRGRGNAEQKTIARALMVGFDGITGDLMSRFGSTDSVPGVMAKLQQKFFKLNLMSWWNDSHRTGMALMMSNFYANQARTTFDNLGPRLKNVMQQYNIGELEWNLFRKHAVKTAENGEKYLVSEGLEDVSDEVIAQYLRRTGIRDPSKRVIQDTRDELISRLDTFFMDRADHGIPMPGAAERAIMNQGTEAGTLLGEVLRHFSQFKSFPITMIRRGMGREMYGGVGGKKDITGLVQLMVATTVFGYGAMYMKDILKNRTPRTFTGDMENDSKLLFAAMAQGGGLGIYGDFLFGEFSRYGRSALSTLAGPTIGQVDDVAELWTRFRTGEDLAAQTLRMAINNTPFQNLFYTRTALDFMFLYQMQETVNPGYLGRLENRIMRENNQRFFIPPTSKIPYGGGDRLLEGVR